MPSIPSKSQAAIEAPFDNPILPEDSQIIRRDGWYQVLTPSLRNGAGNEIALSLLREAEIDKTIHETIAQYRRHELTFKWSIGPMSSPQRLETELAKLASTSWHFRGMALETTDALKKPEKIRVERVTTANFDEYLELFITAWGQQEPPEQARARLGRFVRHPRVRTFLARKEGKAIGSASTLLKEGYGYLIAAHVLESRRGCGAYRALVASRMEDMRSSGFGFAVTQAREATSAPVLDKLGFETVFNGRIYRFDS